MSIYPNEECRVLDEIKAIVQGIEPGGGGGLKKVVLVPEQELELEGGEGVYYGYFEGDIDDTTPDTKIFKFNSVEYELSMNEDGTYGAPYDEDTGEFDFSEYPFSIYLDIGGGEISTNVDSATLSIYYFTDTKNIRDNGKYDVEGYKYANVNNPIVGGELKINIKNTTINVNRLGILFCGNWKQAVDDPYFIGSVAMVADFDREVTYYIKTPLSNGGISIYIPLYSTLRTLTVTSNTEGLTAKKIDNNQYGISVYGEVTSGEITLTFS